MLKTIPQTILDELLTSLYDINTSNGYNYSVEKVEDGVSETVNVYPTIQVQLGDELAESYFEDYTNATSKIDLWLLCYLNTNSNSERDKFISDVKTFFYQGNVSGVTAVFPFAPGENYIQSYTVEEVIRPLDVGQVTIHVEIKFAEIIQNLTLPDTPTLILPANTASETTTLFTVFDWSGSNSVNYELQIATDNGFGGVVYDRTGIVDTAYTLPSGSNLPNSASYYWRVRGRNIAGYGSWSSAYTYTLNIGGYESESIALFDRMTTQPSTTRKGYINTFIKTLKDGNIWTAFDAGYLYGAHTNSGSEALLNIFKNKHNSTLVAPSGTNPVFTVDKGFAGSNFGYINTNYNASGSSLFTQNNNSVVFVTLSNKIELTADYGSNGNNTTYPAFPSTNYLAAINGNQWSIIYPTATSQGAYYNRRTGTAVSVHKGLNLLLSGSQGSIAIPNSNYFVLAQNNGSGIPSVPSSTRTIFGIFFGRYLSQNEMTIFDYALNTYMSNIGTAIQ